MGETSTKSTEIIGGLLAALGIGPGSRGVQDVINVLRDNASGKPTKLTANDIRAGDFVLHSGTNDLDYLFDSDTPKPLQGILNGRTDRSHSYVVLPDSKGKLRVVAPNVNGGGHYKSMPGELFNRSIRSGNNLKRLIAVEHKKLYESMLKEKGSPLSKLELEKVKSLSKVNALKSHLNRALRIRGKSKAHMGSVDSAATAFGKNLSGSSTVNQMFRGKGIYEIFRPKTDLTKLEISALLNNASKLGNMSVGPRDELISGIREFITPLVDRNRLFTSPRNCAGGVCSTYAGIRKTFNPDFVTPGSLPHMKDFRRVGQVSIGKLLGLHPIKDVAANQKLLKQLIPAGKKMGIAGVLALAGAGVVANGRRERDVGWSKPVDKVRDLMTTSKDYIKSLLIRK